MSDSRPDLGPDETELVGGWTVRAGRVERDSICQRVDQLTAHTLQLVAVSPEVGAWRTLFRDPGDGRLWERTYPEGDRHGGGPPHLAVIDRESARRHYGEIPREEAEPTT